MSWFVILGICALIAWIWSGLVYLAPGFKGVVTLLGNITGIKIEEEGWKSFPFPLGILVADCHQKTIKLDDLENVVTSDKILVEISGSLVIKIDDVRLYLREVDQTSFKEGLDDIWDEKIRFLVGQKTLEQVQAMKDILADTMRQEIHDHSQIHWGATIVKVNISEIKTDEGVREDQERQEREELQRKGQRVQAEWTGQLENYFMGKAPLTTGGELGPKLSPEMAHELTLYTLELAEKKKVESKTFGLDPTTTTAIITALTAIKGGRP